MQAQLSPAAGLIEADVQVGTAPARPTDATGLGRRRGSNGQAADLGLGLVAAGRVQRTVPACRQAAHRALGVELVQQIAQAPADRQALSEVGQRRQVQPVGAELAARHRVHLGDVGQRHGLHLAPLRGQPAGGPGLAVAGGEGQALHRQSHAGRRPVGHKTPAQLQKGQWLEIARQAHRHVLHRGVQRQRLRQGLVPVDPGAQRGLAVLQIHRQIDLLAQAVHIDLRQVGIERAFPALPVAGPRQQRAACQRPQREALAPIGRRRGVQAELMLPPGIAHHQQHIPQLQRRRAAQLVHPAQHAAPDHELMLLEQPVGRRAAVHRSAGFGRPAAQVQPGHMPAAAGVAPHLQPRILDQQLRKAQAQRQQRRHRQRRRHAWQAQGLAAPAVAQHHIVQREGRHPAGALGFDAADLHRMPERAAGLRLHLRAPIIQAGQNHPVQSQPQRQGSQPQRQEGPEQQRQQRTRQAPPTLAGRVAQRGD